jgi:hypothetical protein
MDFQAWFQIALAALGTVNPAIGGLVVMIGNAVMTIQGDTAEDKALIAQWQAFCQKIVDENREPTPEEHAAARAFADAEHQKAQTS